MHLCSGMCGVQPYTHREVSHGAIVSTQTCCMLFKDLNRRVPSYWSVTTTEPPNRPIETLGLRKKSAFPSTWIMQGPFRDKDYTGCPDFRVSYRVS